MSTAVVEKRMARIKHTMCKVKDCTKPHSARGFCTMHYQRDRLGIPLTQETARAAVVPIGLTPRITEEAKATLDAEAERHKVSLYALTNDLLEVPHRVKQSLAAIAAYAKSEDCTLGEALARLAKIGLDKR